MKTRTIVHEALRDYNNIFQQKRQNLFFIHVPKNGGTHICRNVFKKQLKHYTIRDYLFFVPTLFTQYQVIAVYRDPFERFLSAYSFLKTNGTNEVGVASREMPPAEALQTPEHLANWIITQDLGCLHPALRTQSYYVRDWRGDCSKVCFLEMNEIDHFLSIRTNLPISIQYNKSSYPQTISDPIKNFSYLNDTIRNLYKIDYTILTEGVRYFEK